MCFAQGLGPAAVVTIVYVSCPRQSVLGNRCIEHLWGGSGQLCPVALILQVFQQMTTYRCRIIMIGWPGIFLVLGSGESVHKTSSKTSLGSKSV